MLTKFVMIKQNYPAEKINDTEEAVRNAINVYKTKLGMLKDKKVGIAVGSRGINKIDQVVRAIVRIVKENGGSPVIFNAMGSHGGGTPEGQREVLESIGITESNVEAPIKTCAESTFLGITENDIDVYCNKLALKFDYVILVNRIKPHTDFEDVTESGLFKLMVTQRVLQ